MKTVRTLTLAAALLVSGGWMMTATADDMAPKTGAATTDSMAKDHMGKDAMAKDKMATDKMATGKMATDKGAMAKDAMGKGKMDSQMSATPADKGTDAKPMEKGY